MEYRTLGRTGVKVAPLALGTDNFLNPTDAEESARLLLTALDAGINLIDTSNSYRAGEAERLIGRTLKDAGRRGEALIATKVYYPTGPGINDRGGSRLHVIRACEDSLRRLGTDYIDLYQLHRPDFDVPIDETLAALTDLVSRGLVRYVGSSTSPAWRVLEGVLTAELRGYVRFASEQPPYNLLDRRVENELVPMALRHGVSLLPWSPLAMGMLAGRYSQAQLTDSSRAALRGGIYAERVTPAAIAAGDAFVRLALEANFDPAQLALLWVKDQPGVTAPIIGPRTVKQLENALPVLQMHLPDELRAACDAINPPGGHVANFFNSSGWMRG